MTESESEMRHEGTPEQFYEFIAQQLLQRVTDPALIRPLREYLGLSSVAASQVSGQFPGPPSAEGRSSVAASQGGVFHVDERDILLHAVEELQDMIYKARDPDVEDEDLQGYWTQLTAELGPVAYPLPEPELQCAPTRTERVPATHTGWGPPQFRSNFRGSLHTVAKLSLIHI